MPRTTIATPALIEPLLNYQQAAALLCVSRTTIRRLCYSGEPPHAKLGNVVRIRRADLDAYVVRQTKGASA